MAKPIIRIDDKEAKRQLNVLAAREGKTQGEVTAELIKRAYAEVFSVPRQDVTVGEAVKAAE